MTRGNYCLLLTIFLHHAPPVKQTSEHGAGSHQTQYLFASQSSAERGQWINMPSFKGMTTEQRIVLSSPKRSVDLLLAKIKSLETTLRLGPHLSSFDPQPIREAIIQYIALNCLIYIDAISPKHIRACWLADHQLCV